MSNCTTLFYIDVISYPCLKSQIEWQCVQGENVIGINVVVVTPRCMPRHVVLHDDVIKWKHLPRYWPFVRGIHRSPVKSPHKGQWRGALMFPLICVNKRLSKQSWGWWFETLSCRLWRHRNVTCFTNRGYTSYSKWKCMVRDSMKVYSVVSAPGLKSEIIQKSERVEPTPVEYGSTQFLV